MSREITPLNAWDPEVAQTIEKYRNLIIEEFRAIEPQAEAYDLIETSTAGSHLEFSDGHVLTYRNHQGWDIIAKRQARIVQTSGFGYRAMSFPSTVLAKFALIEKGVDGSDIAIITAEKKYLRAHNTGAGTRPLSIVNISLAVDHQEEIGAGQRKKIAIESSIRMPLDISELEVFFLEAVELITI